MAMITVTVDDAGRAKLDEVAGQLKTAGMIVEQKMERLGVISGQADEQIIARLQQVPGVLNVSATRKVWATNAK
jgi:hypothetical protein